MIVFNQVGTRALIFFKLLRDGGNHGRNCHQKHRDGHVHDTHLAGHVKGLGDKASLRNGYLGKST